MCVACQRGVLPGNQQQQQARHVHVLRFVDAISNLPLASAASHDPLQCCSYLSWDTRLMMLHNVAAGLSYLHARNHIHGDLRSPNLFVGADGMVS
jgi:hypothetical protein